ncbi:hypothetical protein J7J83_01100 [bacterium]|nr:hypothetical protein [bacterium]
MTIDNLSQNENLNTQTEIKDVAEKIISYLTLRINEIDNSIYAQTPDENGNYPESYYRNKDERDQLNSFIEIILSAVKEVRQETNKKAFIQTICKKIQNYPKESYKQLFRFIEETFEIEIKPQNGPTDFYKGWLKYYAEEYGVTTQEIQELIPFEEFQTQDIRTRVRKLMKHFGETESE